MESQLNDGALKPGAAEITSLTGPPLSFHIPASTPRPRPRAPGKHPRGAHPGGRSSRRRFARVSTRCSGESHTLHAAHESPPAPHHCRRGPTRLPPRGSPPDARTRTHPAAAAVPRLAHVLGYLVALVEAHGHRVAQSHGCRRGWGGKEMSAGSVPAARNPASRLPGARSPHPGAALSRPGAPEAGWQQIPHPDHRTNLLLLNGSRGGRAVGPRNSGISSFRGSSEPERQERRALPLAAGGPAVSMSMREPSPCACALPLADQQ